MIFEQLNNSACKTYLVACEATKDAALVDPLLQNVDHYLSQCKNKGLQLRYVIDTHVHADHLSGCAALAERAGAVYVMHQNSAAKCVKRKVADGETLQIGNISIQFLHTPGHTKDSLTLILPDRILTGDFLFLGDGGAGRTDLPGGDSADHWRSIQKLTNLPDTFFVYPGHDYHSRERSTLGDERKKNERFKSRSQNEYVAWLATFNLGPAEWMSKVIQANYLCTQDPHCVEIPCEGNTCEVKAPATASSGAVREISCESLAAALNNNKKPDLLLDVRNPDEYTGELGHIGGARLLPLPDVALRSYEIMEYQNKSIVTICKMGGRSAKAAATLQSLGFSNVQSMAGGMVRWKSLGLPSEK